jgi:hypothetical protein
MFRHEGVKRERRGGRNTEEGRRTGGPEGRMEGWVEDCMEG